MEPDYKTLYFELAEAVCEVCGERFETWDRKTQPARTCSNRCRVALHRKTKRERLSAR